MVRAIAGDKAEIVTLLPAGANPHTFELAPSLIKKLDGSAVIFTIGKGFDEWISGVSDNLPSTELINLNRGIEIIQGDPHYWLSISNAKLLVQNIAETLIRLNPAESETYQANLSRYLDRLDMTETEIRSKMSGLEQKKIITFHDGWRYFARDYGLEVAATVESHEGNEPTPRQLANLEKTIRNNHIKVLFTEPAVSEPLAESICRDFNLRLVALDPFGTEDKEDSYIQLMLENADRVARNLSE